MPTTELLWKDKIELETYVNKVLSNYFILKLDEVINKYEKSDTYEVNKITIKDDKVIIPAKLIASEITNVYMRILFYKFFTELKVLKKKVALHNRERKVFKAVIFDKKLLDEIIEENKRNTNKRR